MGKADIVNDTPRSRTLILNPYVKSSEIKNVRTIEERIEEANGLALAIDLEIVSSIPIPLKRINSSSFVGSGKLDEIKALVGAECIVLVIVNETLTPIQQRNLERAWACKVIDRTALILEIFGERASTREGKLQVELAALEYQKSRLVRSWTHLERQRGGHGMMGGPGEKQIESDRRQINERIERIKNQLDKVKKTRTLHRKARKAIPYPIVSLVGYTNAGKSTLFNTFTEASVYSEDKLFATLDPTMRSVTLDSGKKIILSDTVGFISNLPTELIAAFRATLEEVLEADIILHVRDISHPNSEAQKQDVLLVLEDLGVSDDAVKIVIEVYNKIDNLGSDEQESIIKSIEDKKHIVAISALSGRNCELLSQAIDSKLSDKDHSYQFSVPFDLGNVIAWIYANAHVYDAEDIVEDGNVRIRCSISTKNFSKFKKLHADSRIAYQNILEVFE